MQEQKYKLSKLAQAHLLKIRNYTVNHFSQMQWLNYKDTLLTGFQMLADNPEVARIFTPKDFNSQLVSTQLTLQKKTASF